MGEREIYFRSTWEYSYAKHLQVLKENGQIIDWFHEPKTFWFEKIKRGVRSYLPDFKILSKDGTHYWVEVKGYMDAKSATKIKRFKKYYPEEKLQIVSKNIQCGSKISVQKDKLTCEKEISALDGKAC